MSDQLKQSVSALMDGEAEELEVRRLLASQNSSTVDKQWSRYHLVRDVLQNNEAASFRHLDISMQVSQAISEQAIPKLSGSGSRWWQPVARFAVAASVAVVVVVGVQSVQETPSGVNNTLANSSPSIVNNRVYPVQGASMQASEGSGGVVTYQATELPGSQLVSRAEADLETQKRLDKYILRHTERAALNNSQGMISFARVASFETE